MFEQIFERVLRKGLVDELNKLVDKYKKVYLNTPHVNDKVYGIVQLLLWHTLYFILLCWNERPKKKYSDLDSSRVVFFLLKLHQKTVWQRPRRLSENKSTKGNYFTLPFLFNLSQGSYTVYKNKS